MGISRQSYFFLFEMGYINAKKGVAISGPFYSYISIHRRRLFGYAKGNPGVYAHLINCGGERKFNGPNVEKTVFARHEAICVLIKK